MSGYTDMIKYAKQDGLHQWFREFIGDFQKERTDLLQAIRYVASVYDQCPNREDADHDEWCRDCYPFLWLTKGTV